MTHDNVQLTWYAALWLQQHRPRAVALLKHTQRIDARIGGDRIGLRFFGQWRLHEQARQYAEPDLDRQITSDDPFVVIDCPEHLAHLFIQTPDLNYMELWIAAYEKWLNDRRCAFEAEGEHDLAAVLSPRLYFPNEPPPPPRAHGARFH